MREASLSSRQIGRAFEIADRAMRGVLEAHCSAVDGPKGIALYPVNTRGVGVPNISDAEPEIVDAFMWLHARRLAFSQRDRRGMEFITLPRIVDFSSEG